MANFDYETLTYENRQQIHGALAETTVKHIDRGGGLFSPLPFDPAASPSQILETVHLGPVPTSFDEINGIANAAYPDLFPLVIETLDRNHAFMGFARFLLERGEHIFPVTNHGNISDIALFSAAWCQQLDENHWQEQNGLSISHGVTTIGAYGIAASEIVQKIGHVFMSFPRTTTIDNLKQDLVEDGSPVDIDGLVDTNNRDMRAEVKHWLGDDIIHKLGRRVLGKSLHFAWSGKTDMVSYGDNHQPEHVVMGKVSNGTIDIVKRGLVLPVVMWDGTEPVVEIGDITEVKNRRDAFRVQLWQRETLAKALGLSTEVISVED